ncbi:MAG: hypothetical protein A2790_01960 [Phenylobacterium sp. RIFCSPHIGHO2_01_FULL_69_31]|uniref:DUF2189 domain-containing protein n=1 Tax=Phenylobacterium sp. RIFCSPHIGHO2_01_FULL_69_31 TaxID=1801944 RepID=UPI0008D2D09D|nr:DUF2189 domain-containing protein [Phenylobacterium sp. RIFCSPHIGHO2_01_FULL_69_31]OHB31306.1 MAG: hypothetical protein A2790_01960 [Phenylobacterium sp. RIFCSPHIGHO2_01_FULL_69_31]
MAVGNHVENPFEYVLKGLAGAFSPGRRSDPAARAAARAAPQVRRITAADLWASLRKGVDDFAAARDDVIFIAVIYPLAGLVLAATAFRYALLPMIFPLLSGFALIGPLAAIGLYEISRRRERGETVSWMDAVGVLRSPAIGSIIGMGLILVGLFALWLATAYEISLLAFGDGPPVTVASFVDQVFATGGGWAMIAIGIGVGFLFAVAALAISVVSFPLLLDRHVGVDVATRTSLKVVAENPGTMALWGLVVAGSLVIGALPALLALIVVVPVLGHASWHLYRRAVA